MALTSRNVLVLFGAAFQFCLRYAQASQIAAFVNAGFDAPQVVMYDSASESILYSLCNSYETPIFPGNKSAAFELPPEHPPLPGTHVSVIGYADQNGTIQVSSPGVLFFPFPPSCGTCIDEGLFGFRHRYFTKPRKRTTSSRRYSVATGAQAYTPQQEAPKDTHSHSRMSMTLRTPRRLPT